MYVVNIKTKQDLSPGQTKTDKYNFSLLSFVKHINQ